MRLKLLALSLLGLLCAYNVLPHRGPDLAASRYQTLLKVSQMETQTFHDSKGKPFEIKIYNTVTPPMAYLNTSYEDPGLYWLMDIMGASWSVVEFGLLAVAIGLLSLRAIPVWISLPALIALSISFPLGLLYWSWDVYWAPALAVLLTMAFLLGISHRPPLLNAIVFGLFVGLLGLVRQDAGLVAQASAAVFSAVLLRTNVRMAAVVLCFLLSTFVPKLLFRDHVALSGVEVVGNLEHGIWHNVYIGMGFIDNPYGIRWDDTVGAEHALERGAKFGTPEYQPTMRRMVFDIVSTNPGFFARSVVARFVAILALCYGFAASVVGWAAWGLLLWPSVFLTKHRWVYAVVVGVAFLPSVLTYPARAYVLGVGMGLLACPLFAIGAYLEERHESARE